MRTVPVIEIGQADTVAGQAPVRRLLSIVLLLALKDRATEVRFEPSESDGEWKLRYEVADHWYEMVPVPLDVPISQEVRQIAGLRSSFWKKAPNEGTLRVVISGQSVEIMALIQASERGSRSRETVILRLPPTPFPVEEAGRILREYLGTHPGDPT
jgi:type IV pilus assembly protein PilB